jgi:hypothetical protein
MHNFVSKSSKFENVPIYSFFIYKKTIMSHYDMIRIYKFQFFSLYQLFHFMTNVLSEQE